MKTHTRLIISFLIISLTGIFLLMPTSARHALEHNLWTVTAAEAAFGRGQTPALHSIVHPHAYQWLARLALREGDSGAAMGWLLMLGDTRDPFVLNSLAQANYDDGRYLEAFDLWHEIGFTRPLGLAGRRALDTGDLAISTQAYRAAYDLEPERFAFLLARVLRLNGEIDQAEAILTQSLDDYLSSGQRADWWRLLGEIRSDRGDWDGGESVYGAALEEDPTDYRTWISLGWLLYDNEGDVEGAQTHFKEAIAVAPGRGDGYYAMGLLMFREGRFDEAEVWFADAIDRVPDNRGYLMYYAGTFRELGQLEESIAAYHTLLDQFPNYARGHLELARVYHLQGSLPEAVETVERALILMDTPNINFYVIAGEIYESFGSLDKAIEAYQAALEINPDSIRAHRGIQRLTGEE